MLTKFEICKIFQLRRAHIPLKHSLFRKGKYYSLQNCIALFHLQTLETIKQLKSAKRIHQIVLIKIEKLSSFSGGTIPLRHTPDAPLAHFTEISIPLEKILRTRLAYSACEHRTYY